MTNLHDQKTLLRRSIQERLAHRSKKNLDAESRSLCRRIREVLPKEPGVIAGYVPMPTEPNIRPLLEELLSEGWIIALPAFEKNALVFRRAESLERLVMGPLKILEPPLTSPPLNPEELSIALVPARAYTKTGKRLGRGNGGYDIWIRRQRTLNPQTKFWGVCFEAQMVNDVPMDAHDETVDAVITARGKIDN
ncbi:5-formyltetrahydrofolate cyclo-ligase [Candidatus Peregrinibacteria bacterium]|nr:5-formyltetrahydrofolate cyclo-ligase [Candidatus Peregrinibacteria bacterium]MBI3816298.1 5-formyltetrahydrofolate cyclo-ligase [Candidatus Peregrinibacteria bacterium]